MLKLNVFALFFIALLVTAPFAVDAKNNTAFDRMLNEEYTAMSLHLLANHGFDMIVATIALKLRNLPFAFTIDLGTLSKGKVGKPREGFGGELHRPMWNSDIYGYGIELPYPIHTLPLWVMPSLARIEGRSRLFDSGDHRYLNGYKYGVMVGWLFDKSQPTPDFLGIGYFDWFIDRGFHGNDDGSTRFQTLAIRIGSHF